MSKPRFQDTGRQMGDFLDEVLVRCPRCDGQARVRPVPAADSEPSGRPRLVCGHCGYTTEHAAASPAPPGPVDPVFHRPLWLQVPCTGETLWATNAAHLDFLESYVRAELREDAPRGGLPGTGIRNATLASRLPRWIKRAKHRDAVLACLARLRQQLDKSRPQD